jgi:hypothetical protein
MSITKYHTDAKRVRNLVKNGTVSRGQAMNTLENIWHRARKHFNAHLPTNTSVRNSNANKVQEIMRWSQGNWNYKAR